MSGLYICHNSCYEGAALCFINLVWSFNGVISFIAVVFLQNGFPDLKTEQEDNIMLKHGFSKDWAVKVTEKGPDKRNLCDLKSFQTKIGVKSQLKHSGELS